MIGQSGVWRCHVWVMCMIRDSGVIMGEIGVWGCHDWVSGSCA